MKTAIVTFSMTGNNCTLAKSVAKEMEVVCIQVETAKKFTRMTLLLDLMFKRVPKVYPEPKELDQYDEIVFVGPIWMGQVATPLRAYFEHIKDTNQKYSFVTVCGGVKGGNPGIEQQLIDKAGRAPGRKLELYTSKFLPKEDSKNMKSAIDYQLTEGDIRNLTDEVVNYLI